MINSFYKYGPAKKNYGEYKCMDAIKNLEIRLQKYKETGNTEYLVDCWIWRCSFDIVNYTNARSCCLWGR